MSKVHIHHQHQEKLLRIDGDTYNFVSCPFSRLWSKLLLQRFAGALAQRSGLALNLIKIRCNWVNNADTLLFMETADHFRIPTHSKYSSCHLICLFATSTRLAEQSSILSTTFQNTTITSLVNQLLIDSCTQFGITLVGGCLCVSSRRSYLMHSTLCICTCWRYSQDRFYCLTLALLTFHGGHVRI